MRSTVLSVDRAVTILDSAFSFESNRTGIQISPCGAEQLSVITGVAGVPPLKVNAYPLSTLYQTIIWELMLKIPGAVQHNNSIRCQKLNICVRNMADLRVYFPPDMVLKVPEMTTSGTSQNYPTIDPTKVTKETLQALYNWVSFLCAYTFSPVEDDYTEPVTVLDKSKIYVAFHNGYMGLLSYSKSERSGWRFWENGFYTLLDALSDYHVYNIDSRLEGVSVNTIAGKAGIKLFERARSEDSSKNAVKLHPAEGEQNGDSSSGS